MVTRFTREETTFRVDIHLMWDSRLLGCSNEYSDFK